MKRVAICPGSFDPVTYGHIDIFKRAAELFDEVYILVASNREKHCHFTAQQRLDFLSESVNGIPNLFADIYDGLTADYARQKNAVAIVRGLRATTDFEYEFQLALINKKLYPDCDTVFLTAAKENMYMSSSIVRQLASFDGDISEFVPQCVISAFKDKKQNNR